MRKPILLFVAVLLTLHVLLMEISISNTLGAQNDADRRYAASGQFYACMYVNYVPPCITNNGSMVFSCEDPRHLELEGQTCTSDFSVAPNASFFPSTGGNIDGNSFEPHGNIDGVPNYQTQTQENWFSTCRSIEWGLVSGCATYVNPDGSLTVEGERARGCITNGALISGLGAIGFDLPIPVIIGLLEPAAKLTHCDNIVDFAKLKLSTDPTSVLKAMGIK